MKSIVVDDLNLHVQECGDPAGQPVVFANSLGTDMRVWDKVLARLPRDLRIIRFDKRGHGLSDVSPAPYTMDMLATDTAAILDHLSVKGAVFVGLSIGGMIGLRLSTMRPDLVSALLLMDSAAKIGTTEMWRDRITALETGGIANLSAPILERWFTPAFHRQHPEELAMWRNMLERTSPEGYIGCCAAIAAADLTQDTAKLSLPFLALAGAQDGATPPDLVRATAALVLGAGAGANFHQIDGAG
ncbi:MAG: 3-oxoadipate enol-lactonase, partial [Halocynthiibacter sp.]